MPGALLLLLLLPPLQESARIEGVRTLTGGAARAGAWLPLLVDVSGPEGHEAVLLGQTDAGFRVRRSLRIPPGGRGRLVVPVVPLDAKAPIEIFLEGGTGPGARRKLDETLRYVPPAELILLAASNHPLADTLRGQTLAIRGRLAAHVFVADPGLWPEIAPPDLLEIADILLVREEEMARPELIPWRIAGGRVVSDIRGQLETLRGGRARFPSVDPLCEPLRVRRTWIDSRRDAALVFFPLYAFGVLVISWAAGTGRLGIRAWLGSMGALILAACGGVAFAFPRGPISLQATQAWVDSEFGHELWTLHQIGSDRREPASIPFRHLPKPVFPSAIDAQRTRIELRWEADGSFRIAEWHPLDSVFFFTKQSLAPELPAGGGATFTTAVLEYFKRGERRLDITARPVTQAGPVSIPKGGAASVEILNVLNLKERR